MKLPIPIMAFCSWLLVSGAATANDLRPLPLDEQFNAADLVVIAELGIRETCIVQNVPRQCVLVEPEFILKDTEIIGHADGVFLLLDSQISEAEVSHFNLHGRFFIFMRNVSGPYFQPVRGYHSLLLIEAVTLPD
ncbi:hypothetical protein [Maricaulis sp.]|uniref:hypothetical protein n=1 Tax=Maricaulis sp. TaxID=1486257 RepID=UPI003A8FAA25